MKIRLTNGMFTIIDESDFDLVKKYDWFAQYSNYTKSYYAYTHKRLPSGKRVTYSMHRLLLGLEYGDKLQGDHINRDTLDNRGSNLRIATHAQNQHNTNLRSDNKSGFKGVSMNRGRWWANIQVNKKQIFLGYFEDKEDAAKAYDQAAIKYHGEFASLNNTEARGAGDDRTEANLPE